MKEIESGIEDLPRKLYLLETIGYSETFRKHFHYFPLRKEKEKPFRHSRYPFHHMHPLLILIIFQFSLSTMISFTFF